MTIQDILPKYYEFKLKRVKVSTLSAYQIIERNYISPYFKGDISSGITHKQIVEFVDLLGFQPHVAGLIGLVVDEIDVGIELWIGGA